MRWLVSVLPHIIFSDNTFLSIQEPQEINIIIHLQRDIATQKLALKTNQQHV